MKMCHFCGNKNFRVAAIQYTYRHADKFLIVEDVPCTKCEYCGEAYLEAKVLKLIEKEFNAIHHQGKTAQKELQVPVERFAQLGG